MRPFFITLVLTAIAAALHWWQQDKTLTELRGKLLEAQTKAASPDRGPVRDPQPVPKRKEPGGILHQPDGSPVVTSRSLFRAALQAAAHVRDLSRSELEALLAMDKSENTGESAGLAIAIWGRLGELDPAAALALATGRHEDGLPIVLHDWLIRDRAAALSWFHRQPDSPAKASFIGVAGIVLAGQDPELFSQLTGNIDDPDLHRKSLVEGITSQGLSSLDAALARFPELPDAASRGEVLQSLIMFHGQEHPRELLEVALSPAMETGNPQNNLGMLLGQMAANDPNSALQWITSRPEPEIARLHRDSPGITIANLGRLDTAAVSAAAEALPAADREWILANHYAGRPIADPAAALAEASAALTGESLRAMTLTHLIQRSIRAGTEAQIDPWLNAQPEDTRTAIRGQISKLKAEAAAGK